MKIPESICFRSDAAETHFFEEVGRYLTFAPKGTKTPSHVASHLFPYAVLPSATLACTFRKRLFTFHREVPPIFGKATLNHRH